MKVLITGSKGQLGSELIKQIDEKKSPLGFIPEDFAGAEVVGVDIEELDITDKHAVSDFIEKEGFDVIFNCAAFTNVDLCETENSAAFSVNADAPGYIAKAAKTVGAKLVHVSTDYVFSGDAKTPRLESDATDPKTVYGRSKLEGERRVMQADETAVVVRTAWLYGLVGRNFVKTIMDLAKRDGLLTVVSDQLGSPTNAADLSHHMLKLAVSGEKGIFHCTNKGICSWYDFAVEIVKTAGIKAAVKPCSTAEFPRPAPRPAYSALESERLSKAVGDEMRGWKTAIECYLSALAG